MIGLSSVYPQKKDEFRKKENIAFREGEKLTFDVKYGFVTAGIASFEIPKVKKISGRNAYHVTFEVNTVPTFDAFFKVRDRYETYIDVDGIFPLSSIFEKEISQEIFLLFSIREKAKQKPAVGNLIFQHM
jgi:hypothetical protein